MPGMQRLIGFGCAVWLGCCVSLTMADELPLVSGVAAQPLKAQARRVALALESVGEPLSAERQAALQKALDEMDDARAVEAIQKVFDPLCIAGVHVNPESRVKAQPGAAKKELVQHGWRVFLVKVNNEAGVTAPLGVSSPNAAPLFSRSTGSPEPKPVVSPADVQQRWLEIDVLQRQPLNPNLSGLELEYRVISLYSRDQGKREATLTFDVGQGTQDSGFRSETPILFECLPAVEVTLEVIDHDGQPTTAWFVLRDKNGRAYPARSRRLEPDFFFHDQVYRHHGESVLLPPGEYEVTYSRGPEYHILKTVIHVPDAKKHRESFRLQRWIKLADLGWYSGDHHVHAAGCAHYESPTQGVTPEAMMRHILGEDLNVGCVLSWGPCWYHQKQYFEGDVHQLSTKNYLMRYDVEVSGFPSSHCGHLCLLRLKDDDYPGTERIDQWPSWNLPVLKWGKEQGGVVGYSHSGWGLKLPTDDLPNYNMPPFDGIGANEYVVDVVHDVCDFISAVDTPSVWELNVWYHTLNCGYTCRISGETDFPCIYGERVGLGRVYVKLGPDQPLTYDAWALGLRDGRSYCSDGLSHLVDFRVNDLEVGQQGAEGKASVLNVPGGQKLHISARVAALLEETPNEDIRRRPLDEKPYWHVERARIGDTRQVPVELIVNGYPLARKEILADGSLQEVQFEYTPDRSSWVALRIFPSSHTNPIFVQVDGKPIRASRRSAEWCAQAVDVCWNAKRNQIRESERAEAKAAYDHAKATYLRIAEEAFDDRK